MQYLGVADPRFNAENFGDQPSWLIFQFLEFYQRKRREQANLDSAVHARGWAGLFNGFGGKGSKLEAWQLMPFPEDAHPLEQRISKETLGIIVRLIDKNKIPNKVLGALVALEEISIAVQQLEEENEEE